MLSVDARLAFATDYAEEIKWKSRSNAQECIVISSFAPQWIFVRLADRHAVPFAIEHHLFWELVPV